MRKVIFQTLLGLLLIVVGIGTWYLSVIKFLGIGPIFLAMAIAVSLVGIFYLYRAGTTDPYKIKFSDNLTPSSESESLLQKNNKLVADYYKTVETKDKLKILKTADDAGA